MSVLVIETSISVPTLALLRDDGEAIFVKGERGRASSESLAILVAPFVGERTPYLLKTIVVSKGPGSATGIRIGAAFGRGLADALGASLREVSLIDAFTASKRAAAVYCGAGKISASDAEGRRSEFGFAEFPAMFAASDVPLAVTSDLFERTPAGAGQVSVIENAAAEILLSGIWK